MTLLDNWGLVVGLISSTTMFYRMNLGMEQEFSDKEELVKDPLGFAVDNAVTFTEFQADSWKSIEALFAAIQFRNFYNRFRPIVDPSSSKICMVIVFGFFLLAIAQVQVAATVAAGTADPKINNIIGGLMAVIVASWWAVIDHGKALKKSVEKLRIKQKKESS